MIKKVIWGGIIILILIFLIQVMVADKYKAQVVVIEGGKQVGINPTTEQLDFGDLSPDTSLTRYINLNAGGVDTYIHLSRFGEIGELIEFSENNFTIKKGEEKKLELTLYMPPSAPIGEKITGRVWLFKIPKFW